MEEEERARIEAEAMRKENVEQRLKALEGKAGLFQWAILGAAATIFSGIWEKISAAITVIK